VLTIGVGNKCSNIDKEPIQDEEIIKALAEIFSSKDKYRKIIQAGIGQWVKDFQAGRIKIETVDDLKKLIEIDIQLSKEELFLRSRNSRQQRR